MSSSARKRTGIWVLGIAAAALCAFVILAIGVAAFFYLRYRQTGNLPEDASQSRVVISHPANMAEFSAGSPIEVQVNAVGLQPFTSIELWINGVLEGVQAGPPSGLTSLASSFSWIPSAGGSFSLVARAINSEHETFVSSSVIIFINPPEDSGQPDLEAVKTYPAVYPASDTGDSVPKPPSSEEVLSPASPWQGTPANWLNDHINSTPPTAPELIVTTEGCNAIVEIHDLSENEEGFALYRQTTIDPYWAHVSDLASHAGQGWIQYEDDELSGGITYYVDAFNGKGKTSSNLVLVNIDPQACPVPHPSVDLSTMILEISNLIFEDGAGSVYCYSKLGSEGWSRWPALGFLTSSGQDNPLLVKSLLLSNLSDSGILPGPQTMDLKLECWGWEAGKLRRLGTFMDVLDLETPLAIHASFSSIAFDVSPHLITGLKRQTFELGVSTPFWLNPYYVENLGFVPESDQMPIITANVTSDPNDCMAAIQGGDLTKLSFCSPLPGFNVGPGGANPQLYLVWSVASPELISNSCKGWPDKECFSLSWWQHFVNANPAPYSPTGLTFRVFSQTFSPDGSPAGGIAEQVGLSQQAWKIVPDQPLGNNELCHNGFRSFQVSLYARTGVGDFKSDSNQVSAPCVHALGDTVEIMVNFHAMDIENIDDGIGDSTADNVYGQFTARVNGQLGPTLVIGWWNGVAPGDEGIGDDPTGFIGSLDNGVYDLAGFNFCGQPPYVLCRHNIPNQPNIYNHNNNLLINVRSGDALQLFSELYDDDELPNHDDAICNQYVWVGPRSLEQWAVTTNEQYNLIQPEGDSTCHVLVILNAVLSGQ